MPLGFEKYYKQGLMYLQIEKYLSASDCFKKATQCEKSHAESWHYAGVSLMKMYRQAEGGMYLRKALMEYETRIQKGLQKDYNLYSKARVEAVLGNKHIALKSLRHSVQLNPLYAEKALKESDFQHLYQDFDFLNTVEDSYEKLQQMRYRGEKLQKKQLSDTQKENRISFKEVLQANNWKLNDFEDEFNQGKAITPQIMGEYTHNENLTISLSYYLDENLVFMELENRLDNTDVQAYRFYKDKNIQELLQIILSFQQILDTENWEDLIEAMIEVCDQVYFEMPDGRKVKVS